MEVTDRKVNRLKYLIKQLKKVRSVQGGLLQLSELASKVQDLTQFYPALNHVVSSILQADNFYIALENEQQELELVYFVDEKDDSTVPEAHDIETGVTGYVYKTGSSLLCERLGYRDMVNQGHFQQLGSEPELWFGVPLLRSGRCIGVMAVQSYKLTSKSIVNEQTVALFESLGSHLMTAINRIKRREFLEQEVKRQTADLQHINHDLHFEIKQREQAEKLQEVLFQISEMSASNLDMKAFYKQLHLSLSQLMDAKNCYIALIEDDVLRFPFFIDKYRTNCEDRQLSNGLSEYTINTRTSQLIDKYRAKELQERGLVQRVFEPSEHISTCWLGAPLIIDDEVSGVITVQSYNDETQYTEKDLQLLTFVSHHIARAIERKLSAKALQESYDELEKKIFERTQELRQTNLFLRLQVEERKKAEQKLFHQANHDALTSLPNRSCFLSKIEFTLARAKRHPEHKFALLFIDLDNFKKINDGYGHQAGDAFLVEVSERLTNCVRDNDVVARLGGDEFVVLLDLLPDSELAEDIASRIIENIALPFNVEDGEVYSGASIGITIFEHDYQDVESIVQDADLAMYHAKSLGRGQYVVFSEDLRGHIYKNNTITDAVRQALINKQVHVAPMPINSLSSDVASCFYMVPKWQHPMLMNVELEQCRHQIEQAGLKVEFDYEFIRQLAATGQQSEQILLPITTTHLTHLKLTKTLIEELKGFHESAKVCLLFREQSVNALDDCHLNNIKQLKRAGFDIGISKFGEANLTVGLLSKFPIDFLLFEPKVIKSVAANPADSVLIRAILMMCLELKIRPVICGVELPQHLTRADELNVDLVCGELITQLELKKNSPVLTIQHSA